MSWQFSHQTVITLVVTFPMQLDSPDLEFIRESYCISGSAVSLLSGRSLRSSGPESPVLGFPQRVFFLFSPWWGPEFPAQGAGVSARGRSFRSQPPEFLPVLFSSGNGSPPGGGRSFRPGPEFPVTRAGDSGVNLAATALFLGGV